MDPPGRMNRIEEDEGIKLVFAAVGVKHSVPGCRVRRGIETGVLGVHETLFKKTRSYPPATFGVLPPNPRVGKKPPGANQQASAPLQNKDELGGSARTRLYACGLVFQAGGMTKEKGRP